MDFSSPPDSFEASTMLYKMNLPIKQPRVNLFVVNTSAGVLKAM